MEYIRWLHREFCSRLPEDLLWVENPDTGERLQVTPGEIRTQGVKIGMPLRVMRADKLIATLRVVDVRQRICGAVIQEMGSEKIKVGDRLQADARKNVSLK